MFPSAFLNRTSIGCTRVSVGFNKDQSLLEKRTPLSRPTARRKLTTSFGGICRMTSPVFKSTTSITCVLVSLSIENFKPTPNPLITTGFSFAVDSSAKPRGNCKLLAVESDAEDPSAPTLNLASSADFGSPDLATFAAGGAIPSLEIEVIFTLASVQPMGERNVL